ncbi:MAG: gephyrin-like molybdotransferase Glp [Caulobacteraceae bacterium]
MKLLSVEDARARMLGRAVATGDEVVALCGAHGRVLREDIVAHRPQPPFPASAMDGWAVRAADTPGVLKIIGESAAGHAFEGEVGPGEATRIFTGAPVPAGADAIVIQEDATRKGEAVTVPQVAAGHHVRPAGVDFKAGDRLLKAGARLDPWRLALAASSGAAELKVARKPRVAILSTGEEVVAPGGSPGPFQIFNSGTTALSELIRRWGGELIDLPNIGDNEDDIEAAARACGGDVIVTLGGASVGDHDLVKPALSRLGMEMIVESIAVRPGKPTWFAVLADGRRIVGLPGNPASAMVCAELFLRPFLAQMQGADPAVNVIKAKAALPFEANGNREHWMRARISPAPDGSMQATPFRDQDSSLVSVFEASNALLRRMVGAPAAEIGDVVDVLPLERL